MAPCGRTNRTSQRPVRQHRDSRAPEEEIDMSVRVRAPRFRRLRLGFASAALVMTPALAAGLATTSTGIGSSFIGTDKKPPLPPVAPTLQGVAAANTKAAG